MKNKFTRVFENELLIQILTGWNFLFILNISLDNLDTPKYYYMYTLLNWIIISYLIWKDNNFTQKKAPVYSFILLAVTVHYNDYMAIGLLLFNVSYMLAIFVVSKKKEILDRYLKKK